MRAISEEEFRVKYEKYQNTIYSISLNYVHNKLDAEDITQDVFMKYLSSDEKFDTLDNELYWIIRVTINTSITYIKSKWKSSVTLSNELVNVQEDNNSDALRMRQIISSLKDKYKEVIILYYYQNYKTNEIANILKVSQDTVKKRLERARDLIKKEY